MIKFNQFCIICILSVLMINCQKYSHDIDSSIRIKGSYTMYELTNEWAAEFMTTHPGISVYVEGGGTATGFKGLENGSINIAMASRLIRSEEVSALAEKYSTLGISYLVAKDALSIYVNKENPVNNLSMEELKLIFTGEIDNWKQVGGLDSSIEIVLRPPTSGTHVYFNDFVLENAAYAKNAVNIPSNTALFEYIHNHKNAIGFAGLYAPNTVKKCIINGVAGNEENVKNDTYPLIRYLYLYTIDEPFGARKKFIDWVLSQDGQKIVKKIGFVPLWL